MATSANNANNANNANKANNNKSNNNFKEYSIERNNNPNIFFYSTEDALASFLYEIKETTDTGRNIIFLDKYLIKIICLIILYGYSERSIISKFSKDSRTVGYKYPSLVKDLQILLFTPNEFDVSKDEGEKYGKVPLNTLVYRSKSVMSAVNNLVEYLVDIVKSKSDLLTRSKSNSNNNNNNFVRVDKTNTHEAHISFAYNFIDYSEYQQKLLKKIYNKKMKNEEIFRPSKLYIYFLERILKFYILADNDNTNLALMQELIYNSFVDDCMFDMTKFRGFSRYVSKKHTNEPPTENTTRVPKLGFNNAVKKENGGRKQSEYRSSEQRQAPNNQAGGSKKYKTKNYTKRNTKKN